MSWRTRGLRGSALEEMINRTNQLYRAHGIALVQKIPTPITPTQFDATTHKITQAYFEQKSTVDYIGVVQGFGVCFDAKETGNKSFPLANIHAHQAQFMQDFQQQKGIAFFIIHFTQFQTIYFVCLKDWQVLAQKATETGKKSVPFGWFSPAWQVASKEGYLVHYLEPLANYLATLPTV